MSMMDRASEPQEHDAEGMLEQVLADSSITQIVIRSQRDGWDTVCCYQRCPVDVGQRRVIVHVPFYPAFSRVPEVQVAILDPIEGRSRVTDQQKFGARFEVVLHQPISAGSGQQTLLVECVAMSPLSD